MLRAVPATIFMALSTVKQFRSAILSSAIARTSSQVSSATFLRLGSAEQIRDNAREFVNTIIRLKPTSAKGTYLKSIHLSSTMSKGIKIDPKSVDL